VPNSARSSPKPAEPVQAFPVVLDLKVRWDSVLYEQIEHFADWHTGDLSSPAQGSFPLAIPFQSQ
jgi:hypothetical protein